MEASRKPKGFLKKKLVEPPYYRTAINSVNKVAMKPTVAAAGASVGFIVNHDTLTPQPNQTVLFSSREGDSYSKFENFYSSAAEDMGVDLKAASYISCVQQRFRLE